MRMHENLKKEIDQSYQQRISQKQNEIILSRTLSKQKSHLELKLNRAKDDNHILSRKTAKDSQNLMIKEKKMQDLKNENFGLTSKVQQLQKKVTYQKDNSDKMHVEMIKLHRSVTDLELECKKLFNSKVQIESTLAKTMSDKDTLESRLNSALQKRTELNQLVVKKDKTLKTQELKYLKLRSEYTAKVHELTLKSEESEDKYTVAARNLESLKIYQKETELKYDAKLKKLEFSKQVDAISEDICVVSTEDLDKMSSELAALKTLDSKYDAVQDLNTSNDIVSNVSLLCSIIKQQRDEIADSKEQTRLKNITVQHHKQEINQLKDKLAMKEEMEISYIQSIKQLSGSAKEE